MYMIVQVSQYVAVASFSEAWIEIYEPYTGGIPSPVASFSEAWIEMLVTSLMAPRIAVASFSEAWIEIRRNTLQ